MFKKLTKSALIFAAVALSTGFNANATVTAFFSAGSTCSSGGVPVSFTAGGSSTVSLCVTTTTEGLCGFSAQLQAASGESGRFNVTNRTLTLDPNAAPGYPVPINNPTEGTDYGGTVLVASPNAPAPAANQLLATFTLATQPTATNASYSISMAGVSGIDTAVPGASCLTTAVTTTVTPSFALNISAAPTITSAS